MTAVVTGVAGFIGSTLAEALVASGERVLGIDRFTEYYDPELKRRNLDVLGQSDRFELVEVDLTTASLHDYLFPGDVVFHLAGQPGVRASWGVGFRNYVEWNIDATQRLLEACRDRKVQRFVNSSSSSIYGRAESFPTSERSLPAPISPYGVTKLAAEHLATLYGTNFGLPTVSLRYFTVYGPRQRPDMAHRRLIDGALTGATFTLNGDGFQVRDFTFIEDAVRANLLAGTADVEPGSVYNIGGGSMTSLNSVIAVIEAEIGAEIPIERVERVLGDPERTGADISLAAEELGWEPTVVLADGVTRQVDWQRSLDSSG